MPAPEYFQSESGRFEDVKVGTTLTFTKTISESDVYLFAGITGDFSPNHIDAEYIDRQILSFFIEQLSQNKDMAVEQAMEMMGQDDLLTKAAIDASLRNISADQIIAQGVPAQARDMLGMFGFRVVINIHGDVLRMDQPAAPEEGGDE